MNPSALRFACASLAFLAGPTIASAEESDAVLLASIKAAWKVRQDRVNTLSANLSIRTLTAKGSLTSLSPLPLPAGASIPAADATHSGGSAILLSGPKSCIKTSGFIWDFDKSEFLKSRTESSFDGKKAIRFKQTEPGWPQAIIENSKQSIEVFDAAVAPLFTSVRGRDRAFVTKDADLDNYTQARRVVRSGQSLIELTMERNEIRGEGKLWVDPSKDFALVEELHTNREGKLTRKSAITVREVPDLPSSWLPVQWRTSLYRNEGRLFKQVETKVDAISVNGPLLSEGDLAISFPTGTRVHDESASVTDYITKEGSEKRIIRPSEMDRTYDDLRNSEPRDLESGNRSGRRIYFFAGGIVGLFCLLVLIRHFLARRESKLSADQIP